MGLTCFPFEGELLTARQPVLKKKRCVREVELTGVVQVLPHRQAHPPSRRGLGASSCLPSPAPPRPWGWHVHGRHHRSSNTRFQIRGARVSVQRHQREDAVLPLCRPWPACTLRRASAISVHISGGLGAPWPEQEKLQQKGRKKD